MGMAKWLGRFEKMLRRGHYLFHVHTDWTDGKSSLADYCLSAKMMGFRSIVLTEHIRRKPSYDFRALLQLAREQQSIHGLEILVGVEAKVLPNGLVDVPEWILSEIDVLAIAEHSFQGDATTLADSLSKALDSFRNAEFARVWVHPTLGLLKKSAPEPLSHGVLQAALRAGAYIEVNLRYRLPPESLLASVTLSNVVIGFDAHSVADVERLAGEALHWEDMLIKTGLSDEGRDENR